MISPQTVLVTGANRGIGLEITQQMLRKGHRVFATCREPDAAIELKNMRHSFGRNMEIFSLDVDNPRDRRSLYLYLKKLHIGLDLLVNNAGASVWDSLSDLSPDVILDLVRTNAVSPLLLSRDFVPFLERSENPRIIMMSSRLGSMEMSREVSRNSYAYAMSKAGLNMGTVQLAGNLREKSIAVIAQSPGWVRTDMGGADAPLSVSEAVRSMLKAFAGYSIKDTGSFFSEIGEPLPW